jgi:LemA protein
VLLTVALVLFLLAAGGAWIYNRLVSDRNLVAQAFSDVDVQLKRRADLVPALVAAVKAYVDHENATLVAVAGLRSDLQGVAAGPSSPRFQLEANLGAALDRIVMLRESYPSLKADANFRDLSARLVEVEDKVQLARRFYNGAVMQYVTRLETFPDLLVGRLFAFSPAAFFETDRREAVPVRL